MYMERAEHPGIQKKNLVATVRKKLQSVNYIYKEKCSVISVHLFFIHKKFGPYIPLQATYIEQYMFEMYTRWFTSGFPVFRHHKHTIRDDFFCFSVRKPNTRIYITHFSINNQFFFFFFLLTIISNRLNKNFNQLNTLIFIHILYINHKEVFSMMIEIIIFFLNPFFYISGTAYITIKTFA